MKHKLLIVVVSLLQIYSCKQKVADNGENQIYQYTHDDSLRINKKSSDKIMLYKQSIHDLDNIIKANPNDGNAYSMRAYAKIKTGDSIGGCIDFKKAVALSDTSAQRQINKYCN